MSQLCWAILLVLVVDVVFEYTLVLQWITLSDLPRSAEAHVGVDVMLFALNFCVQPRDFWQVLLGRSMDESR